MSDTQRLVLAEGHTVCYAIYGAPAGSEQATVFYFHGTPGSHVEGEGLHEFAAREGLRVVSVTRPGFGGSTVQPTRTLLSFVTDDLIALADHLRVDSFAVLGVSGGGPYALASIAALPPRRLRAVAIVAGMFPLDQLPNPGAATTGMRFANRLMFNLASWAPGLLATVYDWLMDGPLARDDAHPELFAQKMEKMLQSLPAEDRAALEVDNSKFKNIAIASMRDGLRQGGQPTAQELQLLGRPWGFELAKLKIEKGKLILWHGAKDANVPVGIAEQAAGVMPGAELRVDNDLAHLSLVALKMEEIITTLAEVLRESQSQ